MRRPAAAIEPVSPIAASNAALPGPIAIDEPSRIRMRGSSRSFIGDTRTPRGRAWPGHPRLRCRRHSSLKTWMPGTSPGTGAFGRQTRCEFASTAAQRVLARLRLVEHLLRGHRHDLGIVRHEMAALDQLDEFR